MSETVPARIALQVREGRWNLLKEFDLEIEPLGVDSDGVKTHEVSIWSVCEALSAALSDQIREGLSQEATQKNLEYVDWLIKNLEYEALA